MKSDLPVRPPSRALIGLVIVMGVMIVIGLAALIIIVTSRHFHPVTSHRKEMSRTALHVSGQARIIYVAPRANGDVIIGMTAQNGDQRVAIWEPSSGRISAELKIVPTP